MNRKIWAILIVLLPVSLLFATNQEKNPYQILVKHYNATGGLEKWKQEKSSFFDATIQLAGLEGSLKQWNEKPGKLRQELDLKVFKQIEGDDGNQRWTQDTNGKIQENIDSNTLEKREIAKHMENYEFLDPNSSFFKVVLNGKENVNEQECFVLEISNTINKNKLLYYISTDNYYLLKETEFENNYETQTLYSDFKTVDGFIRPFLLDVTEVRTGQTQKIIVSRYQSNIEIDENLFQMPATDVKDFEFDNGINSENIPFQYKGNHIFLYVTVNCDKQIWVLDNGADITCINKNYAEEMGWEITGNLKGEGVNNTVEFGFLELPEYSIQGIKFKKQNVAAIDFSFIEEAWEMKIAGILGYDFLSRLITRIDYANETLSFYDPDTFEYTGNGKIVKAPIAGRTFTLPMTVDGKYSGNWGVDIGSGSLAFHYPFAKENRLLEHDGIRYMGGGAGGDMLKKRVKFNKIKVAGYTIDNPYIDMPVEKSGGAFASDKFVGGVGNPLFKNFVFYMDYENQRLIFEKGDDFNKPTEIDKSGLQLRIDKNKNIKVFYVSSGTPAENAGLIKDDRILTINGIDVEDFKDLFTIQGLFRKTMGTIYDITISRDGIEKNLKLQLKNLYK